MLVESPRPWSTIPEMDEGLIRRWNEVVDRHDDVYLLGDLSFHRREKTAQILSLLAGRVHLIIGNHDERTVRDLPEYFESISQLRMVRWEGERIVLCHYAMRRWDRCHFGAWHLYGHSHGTLPEDPMSLSFDCGVDANDWYPISIQDVALRMQAKKAQIEEGDGTPCPS